ncbi:PP2C family protein-serine/threonine phosphatase [Nocardioides donggukensis]|uniref:SpoIIE family protein phosphatase n=1 Tax=Nocardioides donggukensis TaxID=2774019 RepID=A0A927Q0Y3_9ACTN|nr:SpoIIE family protein phosphatase [Nocardioides donggukensis]MBD8868949.1 SpoIIE family protein phosphatase [Nocardioides donggukensis]
MGAPVRERQARLLADSRASDARARLAQASARSEFLLRTSRTASAVQHPTRAMEALVGVLVRELVDFAQVTVVSGIRQVTTAAVHEGPMETVVGPRADTLPAGIATLVGRAVPDQVPLPAGPVPTRRAAIDLLVAAPALADRLEAQGTEAVLALPLVARGRCFGLLLLARAAGSGFDDSAHPFLEELAQRISLALDTNLVVAESRHVASVLRRAMLPRAIPALPHLDVGSYLRVAHEHEEMGGDFFDLHGPEEDLTVVLGDVSGKGVEAAVHAKRITNAVRTASLVDRDPGRVLELVNRVLVSEADPESEMLATVVCARLRRRPGGGLDVDVANAGHPPAYLLSGDATVRALSVRHPALALLEEVGYDTDSHVLHPGDSLVLYTDGVVETGAPHDLFGEDRLTALLAGLGGVPAQVVVEQVAAAVSEHLADGDHRDDVAVVALRARADLGETGA